MAGDRPKDSTLDELSPRQREIVDAARRILESEGPDALTMRRLAGEIGIQAPSLYKHVKDKAALEVILIEIGFTELAEAVEAIEPGKEGVDPLLQLAMVYRAYALAHPHLYRLLTVGPLPREQLRSGVEARAALPLVEIAGDPDLARALWAFAHGMVILELDGRFPANADLDAAWRAGISAFIAERNGLSVASGLGSPGGAR
jgi:AcrR family transcriptional regulator